MLHVLLVSCFSSRVDDGSHDVISCMLLRTERLCTLCVHILLQSHFRSPEISWNGAFWCTSPVFWRTYFKLGLYHCVRYEFFLPATIFLLRHGSRGRTRRPPPLLFPEDKVLLSKLHKFGQLILRKIIEIVATRCQILWPKCTKFDFGCGSAPVPQTPLAELTESPRPLRVMCYNA